MQGAFRGEGYCNFERFLKIRATFDQLDSERPHCGIFLNTVAMRHNHGCRDAVTARRKTNRLAVIPTGGTNDAARPGTRLREVLEIDKPRHEV